MGARRIDHHTVKECHLRGRATGAGIQRRLVKTAEQVFRRTEGGKLARLAYEADEYLEAFCSAQLVVVRQRDPGR
jgi:hypothetical protein